MAIPGWEVVLSATWAGGIVWFTYRVFLQSGSILLRLDALESDLKDRAPARRFRAGTLYEAQNVVGPVVYSDEYQLSDCRFHPDDVIIDVGAHIGAFTYLCYKKGSRQIHSFEPMDRNFELLEKNFGSVPGVYLSRAAVWRSDGERRVELTISGPAGENTGTSSVLAGGHPVDYPTQTLIGSGSDKRQVSAIALDEILERFDRISLLKIDCEGSEFPILLTSRQLHRVERIVGEVHEIDQQTMALLEPRSRVEGYASYRMEDLVNRLQSLGFCVQTRLGQNHLHLFDARRDQDITI